MLDDIRPPKQLERQKPKRIEPLPSEPKTPIHELAAAEDKIFKTPDQIANEEPATEGPLVVEHDAPKVRKSKLSFLKPPYSKQQKIIGSIAIVLLFFGLGAGWTLTHHRRAVVAETPKHVTATIPAAKPIYSDLSGLPINDAAINQRPVTAVMIENSVDARPQSGLSQAGVVFEAVAEGGVTRFMALFQDQQPGDVGPIRSARPYYVSWALGYNAAYAHVGGSADALSDITQWGVRDLNQFYNGNYYHRITTRDAPHNVYTGIDTLSQLESTKGYTSSAYTPFARKADTPYKAPAAANSSTKTTTPVDTRTAASSLDFSLSGYTYDPHYDYDAASNSYKRSEAGSPQTDANGNAQLNPKVVVAMAVPLSQGALDASGAYYSNYNVVGSGQAWVFQDGTMTAATWTKNANDAPLTFTDSNGKPFSFNRGQTWISAVTDSSKVHYK